jgi:hypothetical protein
MDHFGRIYWHLIRSFDGFNGFLSCDTLLNSGKVFLNSNQTIMWIMNHFGWIYWYLIRSFDGFNSFLSCTTLLNSGKVFLNSIYTNLRIINYFGWIYRHVIRFSIAASMILMLYYTSKSQGKCLFFIVFLLSCSCCSGKVSLFDCFLVIVQLLHRESVSFWLFSYYHAVAALLNSRKVFLFDERGSQYDIQLWQETYHLQR